MGADGRTAIEQILRNEPDLVFLDVQMPEIDGIEVVRLGGPDRMPAVIFVTAYDRYALKAFELAAVDYLLVTVMALVAGMVPAHNSEIVGINGIFVVLWIGSAGLFRNAAGPGLELEPA